MFPGGKGGRCIGLTTLPPSCAAIVLKSGSLNLLEPSGPVQTCNGIALPFCLLCIRNIAWGAVALVHRADNLTTFMFSLSWNPGVWTCWIPQGSSRPVQGLFHHYIYIPCLAMCILKSSKLCDFAACCTSDHFSGILLCFCTVIPWKEVVLMAVVGRVTAGSPVVCAVLCSVAFPLLCRKLWSTLFTV